MTIAGPGRDEGRLGGSRSEPFASDACGSGAGAYPHSKTFHPEHSPCTRCGVRPRRAGRRRQSYCLECHAEYNRRTRPKWGEMDAGQKRRANCRSTLNTYIGRGLIVRPDRCEACGEPSDRAIEGHHDDYAKPFEVRWLCRPCHLAHHEAHGDGENG